MIVGDKQIFITLNRKANAYDNVVSKGTVRNNTIIKPETIPYYKIIQDQKNNILNNWLCLNVYRLTT